MSDNFETLVVEVRPRLQSANVVISLKQKLENVKINLNKDSFKLVAADTSTTVSLKNLKIVEDSLNSLNITDTSVSFRFGTVNDVNDWGSVKLELLKIVENQKREEENDGKGIFVNSTSLYKIQCNSCMNNLMEDVKFSRILPLPSDTAEPSDWFCHANINYNLNPKKNDFFYGNCYCHLQNNFRNIKVMDNVLICNDCQANLGVLKNADTCKLWFNTVRFVSDTVHNTEPLKDVFLSLKQILSAAFYNTVKILLSCQKTTNKQVDYIFLWILEKELTVQIWDSTVNNCRVAKVLFKNESEENGKVKIWKNDVNVISLDISEPMFVEVLKHLSKYNKIFPKEFSESNGLYISYLMLYDTDT